MRLKRSLQKLFPIFILSVFLTAAFNIPPRSLSSENPVGVTAEQAKKRIENLRKEIAYHDDLYFNKHTSEISDEAYDALRSELSDLEKQFPEYIEVAENFQRNASLDFPKHAHLAPMLSLEKAYTKENFEQFQNQSLNALQHVELSYSVEPKYDGIAISATYTDGQLTAVTTRGNGVEGNNLVENIRKHASFPTELQSKTTRPIPHLIEVRGEAFISHEQFDALNQEQAQAGQEKHQSPRNLAAGILRRKEVTPGEINSLSFIFFAVELTGQLPGITNQSELYTRLSDWGLPAIKPFLISHGNVPWTEIEHLLANRDTFPFPCDGLVVKIHDLKSQKMLGSSKTAPRWAIACKPSPTSRLTRLKEVEWQVGRTGRLTPIAIFEPIFVSNAQIERASLHNLAQIKKLDLHQNDTIRVQRSGEVIPAVTAAIPEYRKAQAIPITAPTQCPSCAQPTTTNTNETLTECKNPYCKGRIKAQALHLAQTLKMDNIGPEMIEQLMEEKQIRMPADLLTLTSEQLIEGNYSAPIQIAQSIQKAKKLHAVDYIIALGIPGVGPQTAPKLFDQIDTLEELPSLKNAFIDTYFQEPFNKRNFERLISQVTPIYSQAYRPTPLDEIHFLITGELDSMSRQEALEKIESHGGKVDSHLTNQTNFLVIGKTTGNLYREAQALGISIIDENELIAILANPQSLKSR